MADTKISALTSATTPLAGTEVLPIVQSSTTKKVTVANLTAGRAISASSAAIGSGATTLGLVEIQTGATTAALWVQTGGTTASYTIADFRSGTNASALAITADLNTAITGNLVIGTSGKGIDFSATPGTGTSELFADYEEGTWTPAITFGGGATSLTYAARAGRYTKIGNVVYFVGYIELSNKGSSTGDAVITSLPFTSLSTFVRFRINIGYAKMTGTAPRDGYVADSSTSIQLLTSSDANTLTDASFQNDTQFYFSGFYTVS